MRRRCHGLRPAPGLAARWLPVVLRGHDAAGGCALPAAVSGPGYALIAHGCRLEVPRGFDAREVAALWQLLRASSAREEVV